MSGSKKPYVENMEDEGSESDSDMSSNDPGEYNEEIQIDFEGRNPTDTDCDGIAQLLGRLFLKGHINRSQMADLIVAQNYVGSVIFQSEFDEEEDDTNGDDMLCESNTIFGITTVINITAKKDVQCVEQLRAFILQKAEKHAHDAALVHFRDVLSNDVRHVGFLINERFINIPAKISVPLLENLYKEIQTAKQKKMPFNFVYFVMIVKFYRTEAKKNKQATILYTNQEEEVLCKESVTSFEYSVEKECDSGMAGDWQEDDETLTPFRKVILFDAKQLPQLITDITDFVN